MSKIKKIHTMSKIKLKSDGASFDQRPTPGTIMPDGTIYAGISPNTGQAFYAAATDEPEVLNWNAALKRAVNKDAHGHKDWLIPTEQELGVLFNNHAAISGFNTSGSFPAGWYWSSSESDTTNSWVRRFSDGSQGFNFKYNGQSVRCVRR
jgi:hypothetical protein